MSVLLILIVLLIQRNQGYVDQTPDPDFAPKHSGDSSGGNDKTKEHGDSGKMDDFQKDSGKTERLSGHYKFLIKEILKKNLLSDSQKKLFENADNVDPYSIAEAILGLLPNEPVAPFQETGSFARPLHDLDLHTIQKLVVTYAVTIFCLGYLNKKCRNFLLSLHLLLFYLYAVYSRINKQYGEIKGTKLAAISSIPSHCKDGFSISSYFSYTWSKFQIGDQCGRYHQQVLTDPLYEIQYPKCFVYPFVSVLSHFICFFCFSCIISFHF